MDNVIKVDFNRKPSPIERIDKAISNLNRDMKRWEHTIDLQLDELLRYGRPSSPVWGGFDGEIKYTPPQFRGYGDDGEPRFE